MTLNISNTFTWNETVWNPSMLAPALWLDASDASTITLNGTAVSEWRDKSGNANHVFQPTPSQQPTLGIGEVDFDGIDDMLTAASPVLTGDFSGQLTLFSVSRIRLDAGYLYGAVDTGGTALYQQSDRIGLADTLTGALVNLATHGITYGSRGLIGAVYANQSLIYSFNGAPFAADYSYTFAVPNTNFAVGNRFGGTTSGTYSNASHSEIVAFNQALSESNRQKIEGYFAHKWGLTASLAAGHPYKLTGPVP